LPEHYRRRVAGNASGATRQIPLELREVPTGTQVFDWTVPKEWNIRDAYVKNAKGERVIDFQKSNLHVVNYSVPVQRQMVLGELKEHLFTLPAHPDWIPYRTSYYKESWGFLPATETARGIEGRGVRSLYRFNAGRRPFDVWRVLLQERRGKRC